MDLKTLVNKGRAFDNSKAKEKAFREKAKRWRAYQTLLRQEGRLGIGKDHRVLTKPVGEAVNDDALQPKHKVKKYKGKRDIEAEDAAKSEREQRLLEEGKLYQRFKASEDPYAKYRRPDEEVEEDNDDIAHDKDQEHKHSGDDDDDDYGNDDDTAAAAEGAPKKRKTKRVSLKELHAETKRKQYEERQRITKEKEERRKMLRKSFKNRRTAHANATQRTKKGQPIMKNFVMNILGKLEKDKPAPGGSKSADTGKRSGR